MINGGSSGERNRGENNRHNAIKTLRSLLLGHSGPVRRDPLVGNGGVGSKAGVGAGEVWPRGRRLQGDLSQAGAHAGRLRGVGQRGGRKGGAIV